MTETPHRPLRAVRTPSRKHLRTCAHSWVSISSSQWNDAQRAKCRECVRGGPATPEFTPGCPGCEDVIGWRQWQGI